jgi:hypothetical protein
MGVVGAINSLNPLYAIAKGGLETYRAAEKGDFEAAGEKGVVTAIVTAVTVVGVIQGLSSLGGSASEMGAASAARGPAATRELAQQIANVERFPMNHRRTVSVLETAEGPTLVAGGATDLSASQIAAAQKMGLTPVSPMPGFHAEKTVITGAGELGLTPTKGVTTNIICPGAAGCRSFIEGLGGRVTGDFTYEF